MRLHPAILALLIALPGPAQAAAPLPPGRQHCLTIEGENTITFRPEAGLPPFAVDYKARIEYIVDARLGKDPKPGADDATAQDDGPTRDEPPAKKTPAPAKKASPKAARGKAKAEDPAAKVTGAVDLSLHSSEMRFRQKGETVLESKLSRSKFQGRLQPDAPVLSVAAKDAPPRLQEILKWYDAVAASLLLNADFRVVGRKYRSEGPQRALIETILSIHTPIPRDAVSWESPTQLAMGHGQTAKGTLRFERDSRTTGPGPEPFKVKVSGVLKAEGVVAGNLVKDGTYTVQGEQTYDPKGREWLAARWSVAVSNELANEAGLVVAQARGTMIVESRPAEAPPSPTSGGLPKL